MIRDAVIKYASEPKLDADSHFIAGERLCLSMRCRIGFVSQGTSAQFCFLLHRSLNRHETPLEYQDA